MARTSINRRRLVEQLDELKAQFNSASANSIERILRRLSNQQLNDPELLLQLHEILLFLRAYPQTQRTVQLTESLLRSFPRRLEELRKADVDLSVLEPPDVSGVAGTYVSDTFTFPIVLWLARRYPNQTFLDWEWFEDENRLAEAWPRFMPLLDEDASVEANVPYKSWLAAARGKERDVIWLVRRFDSLKKTEKEKAELFNAQKLYVGWRPSFLQTRTGMRLPVRKNFYHRGPLIPRKAISLVQELNTPSPPLKRLPPNQGEAILDLARAASTIRYRELYGFTYGDKTQVFQADFGRGVQVFVTTLPPPVRLPLRAYHAAMFFKNGVPIGYFEGLSLFERMESGFNLYYTFRDGETAWLYARTLNIFRHLLGVTAFVIDPYQIGYENEEGIESGAFWFYRKLGFRPMDAGIAKLVESEDAKISTKHAYRTSAPTLRKLAAGPMIFELEDKKRGDWDRFHLRNIGLTAQRRMAERFRGDADTMRLESIKKVSKVSGIRHTELLMPTLSDLAVAISLIENLPGWSRAEKQLLSKIIKARSGPDESVYLKLMQQHGRLRQEIIRLGSGRAGR
jgi:hypothetical protein